MPGASSRRLGYPAEEQAEAVPILERFARGIQEEAVSQSDGHNLHLDFERKGDAEQGVGMDFEEVRMDA